MREGWLKWSLDFFGGDDQRQNPHIDITVQVDVTEAYRHYSNVKHLGGSFFACLLWRLSHALKRHPSFNLRRVDGEWHILNNPPVFVPVAVGGAQRFQEMLLEDVCLMDYPSFVRYYDEQLKKARAFQLNRSDAGRYYHLAHSVVNLPNLHFTGLTLHSKSEQMIGQSLFYFGKRYPQGDKLLMPLAAKLHHACTDLFVFDLLLQDYQRTIGTCVPR